MSRKSRMTFNQALKEIRLVADGIAGALGDDETGQKWVKRLREAAYRIEIDGGRPKFKVKL